MSTASSSPRSIASEPHIDAKVTVSNHAPAAQAQVEKPKPKQPSPNTPITNVEPTDEIKKASNRYINRHFGFFGCKNHQIKTLYYTRDYPGLLRQSLKFRETASSHSEKCSFQAHIFSFYVWDHISEGKACIKNPKTCGPSK